MKVEAKYASIGLILIKGNKWPFRTPLEKVSITTYDTSKTTIKR
jgi:hypothetical protein